MCLLELGAGTKQRWGKEVWRGRSVYSIGNGYKLGRLQQLFCYIAGDETKGVDLGEIIDGWKSTVSLPVSLA